MTLHSLPIFVRLQARAVILVGDGEAAAAKRRLLERAGAVVVGEETAAALAIVAVDDEDEARGAIARLKKRGVLVNAVDRPDHCDFTLPAIVDRAPVLVAIGTGGVSAGLAAALRQRLEALLPPGLGALAHSLFAARGAIRARYPQPGERRRALAGAMAAGGPLDPLGAAEAHAVDDWLGSAAAVQGARRVRIALRSADPDDLTLREARWLAQADRIFASEAVPDAILNRARADAARIIGSPPPDDAVPGLSVEVVMAGGSG